VRGARLVYTFIWGRLYFIVIFIFVFKGVGYLIWYGFS